MSHPKMPINPPQPTFNSMSTINFMAMAMVQTAFQVCPKVAFVAQPQSVPKIPAFSELPSGTRYSAQAANSLGAEDTRPLSVPRNPLKGWASYVPRELSEDPMGDSAPEAKRPAAAAPRAASPPAKRAPAKAPSPPPAKKK